MHKKWARAALSHPAFSGITRPALARLVTELQPRWEARSESDRRARRGHDRKRLKGAGQRYKLTYQDRVLVTLAVLRLNVPHMVLAVMFQVDRSQITRAVHQVRPLLAMRGFATPHGVRLRTLSDVLAYAEAEGVELRIDGTEIQVRRPQAGRPGRRAFVSGKKKQNTIKITEITGPQGRTLWAGAARPGRMHDQTAIRTEGIEELLRHHPGVRVHVDDGYRGLAKRFPAQVIAPPLRPGKHATGDEIAAWKAAKTKQSSARICVEHGIAEVKAWRSLQRWTGRREYLPETAAAIAGLVSDRASAA